MALGNDERTLYVANLHKEVSEELLYELFLQAGPVERVNIPSANNKNFRYGFVTYLHECSVDYAIQLYKGTSLYKKELLIKRKGDRSASDQQSVVSDRYSEGVNNSELIQDQSLSSGQSYASQYPQSLSENCKSSFHNSSLMQSSLKGRWSLKQHTRPYNHHSRRHYSPRPFDSRGRHQNYNNNNNINNNNNNNNINNNKSYHDRKGRY